MCATQSSKEQSSTPKKSKPDGSGTTKTGKTSTVKESVISGAITSIDEWSAYIKKNWKHLQLQVKHMGFTGRYNQMLATVLYPVYPTDRAQLDTLTKILGTIRYGDILADEFSAILYKHEFKLTLKDFINQHLTVRGLNGRALSEEISQSLDWLLVATRVVVTAIQNDTARTSFTKQLLEELKSDTRVSSGIRVEAEMISSKQNVGIAGRDVNIVTTYYSGKRSYLFNYLARMCSVWDFPDLGNLVSTENHQIGKPQLHKLYTPIDVFDARGFEHIDFQELKHKRFQAIDDMDHLESSEVDENRRSLIAFIATYPYVVVTGGPGTGKSSFCRYVATCLAHACNNDQDIKGLELLGSGWVHGAILPIYVKLRKFCADTKTFPQNSEDATAQALLDYLRNTLDVFGPELESYLLNQDVPTQGTLLLLDGLDEVFKENDRLFLQRIIDNWTRRFPKCRIVVTSRTYAYRTDAEWKLSSEFKSVELAPFTWKQIQAYIKHWYNHAAENRPHLFDGSHEAASVTARLADDLITTIKNSKSLWALARQPLMLAMLSILHESRRELPERRADLYRETVTLLDRWNPLMNKEFENLNHDVVRNALQLVAYKLQCQQKEDKNFPASLTRKELLYIFDQQNTRRRNLGVPVDDVIEYLSTRNGILVSDDLESYRFPHLTIQEYLAARALIDLSDECEMPDDLLPSTTDGWYFPENMAALVNAQPGRWRNVALFAGSIIASESGQNRRWQLIEALLSYIKDNKITEHDHTPIIIATDILMEGYLDARRPSENVVKNNLLEYLEALKQDVNANLDVPEQEKVDEALKQFK